MLHRVISSNRLNFTKPVKTLHTILNLIITSNWSTIIVFLSSLRELDFKRHIHNSNIIEQLTKTIVREDVIGFIFYRTRIKLTYKDYTISSYFAWIELVNVLENEELSEIKHKRIINFYINIYWNEFRILEVVVHVIFMTLQRTLPDVFIYLTE